MKISKRLPLLIVFALFGHSLNSQASDQLISSYLFFPETSDRAVRWADPVARGVGTFEMTHQIYEFASSKYLLTRGEPYGVGALLRLALVGVRPPGIDKSIGTVTFNSDQFYPVSIVKSRQESFACRPIAIPIFPTNTVDWLFDNWLPRNLLVGNGGYEPESCVQSFIDARAQSDWRIIYNRPATEKLMNGLSVESMKINIFRRPWLGGSGLSGLWRTLTFGRSLGYMFAKQEMEPDFGLTRIDPSVPIETFMCCEESWPISPLEKLDTFKAFPPVLPEGALVEYRNTEDFPKSPGGQFFYTKDASEQALVDSGGAGKFKRTGRSFNIGGYVPVCRYYGSQSPGPNSHFFSAEPGECDGLKKAQISPKPVATQQWNSEGTAFYAVLPMTDTKTLKPVCIPSTIPVYRAYNNAFTASGAKNVWDSNHRYSTNQADIDEVVRANAWKDEGLAFCVPG
jgi:Repeat of unknown function (DUF5648)